MDVGVSGIWHTPPCDVHDPDAWRSPLRRPSCTFNRCDAGGWPDPSPEVHTCCHASSWCSGTRREDAWCRPGQAVGASPAPMLLTESGSRGGWSAATTARSRAAPLFSRTRTLLGRRLRQFAGMYFTRWQALTLFAGSGVGSSTSTVCRLSCRAGSTNEPETALTASP